MKMTIIAFIGIGAWVTACAAPVDSNDDDGTSVSGAEALSGAPHFNFAVSPLLNPVGPAYFTQVRPAGSEMADVLCPGPTYQPTARILDANGATFNGAAGSCNGTYRTASNGQIIVRCSTPIEKHTCATGGAATN